MIVKSPRKKDSAVNIKIESEDDTSSLLERKDRVKYLGVLLDDTVSFKHHISYVASRISHSNGIIAKLRHFLTLSQMRQLYNSIIYPYISYAILAWGILCTYIRQINRQRLPLFNLLDVLTVNNEYRLHILKFRHPWHKGLLPFLFQNYFQYASSIHGYNTRYASKQNLYKP